MDSNIEVADDTVGLRVICNGQGVLEGGATDILTPPTATAPTFTRLAVISGTQTYEVKASALKGGVIIAKYTPPETKND